MCVDYTDTKKLPEGSLQAPQDRSSGGLYGGMYPALIHKFLLRVPPK
jgi:hypothetical protein